MSAWRSVLAADAKKAGIASEDTCLTLSPPSSTGRLACSHWTSDKFELVVRCTESLNNESKVCKVLWETDVHSARDVKHQVHWLKISKLSARPDSQFYLAFPLLQPNHHSGRSMICPTRHHETEMHPTVKRCAHQLARKTRNVRQWQWTPDA